MLEEPAPLRERYGNSWIPRPSSARPREGPRGASVNRRPGIGSRVRSVAPRSNGSAHEYSGPVLADHPETALEPHRLHPSEWSSGGLEANGRKDAAVPRAAASKA